MGIPIPVFSKKHDTKEFLITQKNYIDIQKKYECSAYATAYVMRHYGIQANGEDLYTIITNKTKNGYVYPKGIVKLFRLHGFKATIRIGNILELKKEISKGIPVIVFIKAYTNKNYLHFTPVVGYDEDNFYIAESLKELINTDEINYNRKITIPEFRKLWNTSSFKMPLYRYTYITICKDIQNIS